MTPKGFDVFKRLFFMMLGLGMGLLIGGFVVRRINQATQAAAPSNLARQAGHLMDTLGERLKVAGAEFRAGAAEREAELRAEYEVPTMRDALEG